MTAPTPAEREQMEWGVKLVGTDLCTPDHNGGRFRYRLGAWHTPDTDRDFTLGEPCPQYPGDGLCAALTLAGMQSGGQRLGSSVMLTVGWHPDDRLGGNSDKVRVKRLWVDPDPVDPVALLRWAATDRADLRGANLGGANLGGANLGGADLYEANLGGANLYGANLRGANLRGANLGGANLRGANLGGANLYEANLYGANLYGANLGGANLGGANLRGANLRGANLRGADGYTLPDRWVLTPVGYVAEVKS